MFSDLVILYLFLGGAGAGLLVILSTLEALRFVGASSARWISATVWIPSAFFRMAWPVSFVILSMAILALIADLGRPDRLFAFVLHPRLSVMTIGAYALAIAWGLSAILSLVSLLDGALWFDGIRPAVCAIGFISGLITCAYTGLLLQSSAAVLFWQTPFLTITFVLSSLSCGFALVMLVLTFIQERRPMEYSIRFVMSADSLLIAIEVVTLFFLVMRGFMTVGAEGSAWSVVGGDHSFAFWTGLVIAGLVVPFAIENTALARDVRPQLQWAALLILFGGLVLRWSVVAAGNYVSAQEVQGIFNTISALS